MHPTAENGFSSLLAYAAGMTDADGCIGIQKTRTTIEKFSPRIDVSQNDKGHAMLLELRDAFGGSVSLQRAGSETQRPQYQWTIYGQNAGLLLEELLPYLRVKKKQAKVALSFWEKLHEARRAPTPTWSMEMQQAAREAKEQISVLNRLGP